MVGRARGSTPLGPSAGTESPVDSLYSNSYLSKHTSRALTRILRWCQMHLLRTTTKGSSVIVVSGSPVVKAGDVIPLRNDGYFTNGRLLGRISCSIPGGLADRSRFGAKDSRSPCERTLGGLP